MGYTRPSFDFDYDKYVLDVKQDIETYVDWDVDMKFNVDIDKDVDVNIDVDTDIKDNGSLIEAVIKDIAENASGLTVIADTTSVEDTISSADLTAFTENVLADLHSLAADNGHYYDSGTFTEISVGIDSIKGELAVLTLNMQALVDGG